MAATRNGFDDLIRGEVNTNAYFFLQLHQVDTLLLTYCNCVYLGKWNRKGLREGVGLRGGEWNPREEDVSQSWATDRREEGRTQESCSTDEEAWMLIWDERAAGYTSLKLQIVLVGTSNKGNNHGMYKSQKALSFHFIFLISSVSGHLDNGSPSGPLKHCPCIEKLVSVTECTRHKDQWKKAHFADVSSDVTFSFAPKGPYYL